MAKYRYKLLFCLLTIVTLSFFSFVISFSLYSASANSYTENKLTVLYANNGSDKIFYMYGNLETDLDPSLGTAWTRFDGVGKLNGTDVSMDIKFIGKGDYQGFYVENFGTAKEGDVLTLQGSFTNTEYLISLVLDDPVNFTFNGTDWVYNLTITKIVAAPTAPGNNHVYAYATLDSSFGLNWDIPYKGKGTLSGNECNVQIKIVPNGATTFNMYIESFGNAAINDKLVLSGEFKNNAGTVVINVTETELIWDGTIWEVPVVYETFDVIDILCSSNSSSIGAIYLTGTIHGSVDPSWEIPYTGNVLVNGNTQSATIKYINKGENDDFYFEGFGSVSEGDVVTLSGDFKNQKNAIDLNIKECQFVWTGTMWKNCYTVTFKNYDDSVLETLTIKEGDTPSYSGDIPSKPDSETEHKTYAFSGWNPEISSVNSDVTYTAKFDEAYIKYSVTFKNYDGSILSESMIEYGVMPKYLGDTPLKPQTEDKTYAFRGWTPDFTSVTSDTIYTAVFEECEREYLVTFKNYDGSVIQSSKVNVGEVPEYVGETPLKPSTDSTIYTFAGWDKKLTSVCEEATYTAVFNEETRTYTIVFENYDGVVLQTEEVEYGKTPEYKGDDPTKKSNDEFGYIFKGWNKEIETVILDETYTAEFDSFTQEYSVIINFSGVDTAGITKKLKYNEKIDFSGFEKEGYTYKVYDGDEVVSEYVVKGNAELKVEYLEEKTSKGGCSSSLLSIEFGILFLVLVSFIYLKREYKKI